MAARSTMISRPHDFADTSRGCARKDMRLEPWPAGCWHEDKYFTPRSLRHYVSLQPCAAGYFITYTGIYAGPHLPAAISANARAARGGRDAESTRHNAAASPKKAAMRYDTTISFHTSLRAESSGHRHHHCWSPSFHEWEVCREISGPLPVT